MRYTEGDIVRYEGKNGDFILVEIIKYKQIGGEVFDGLVIERHYHPLDGDYFLNNYPQGSTHKDFSEVHARLHRAYIEDYLPKEII